MSSGSPAGFVTRYSCAIGTIGTLTPASAPISRAYMPPAFDDDLGLDLAPVGLDGLDAASPHADPRDARALLDLGPAAPRALGERERELARVDVAVRRQVRRAEHAVRRHRREELLRLGRRDQLEREAEGLRPARLARDLLHPLRRRGEPERADLVPAGLEADLVLERPVQLDALHHHPRQRERAPQLADEPGRVERRAARQLGPLDEHDVVPAEAREPVRGSSSRRRRRRSRPLARSVLIGSLLRPRARGREPDLAASATRPRNRAARKLDGFRSDEPLPDTTGVRLESRLRRARGAGRSKPPEEHYAEAEGSSGRWTKAIPARRILSAGPSGPATFSLQSGSRAHGLECSHAGVKRKVRNLRQVHFPRLDDPCAAP